MSTEHKTFFEFHTNGKCFFITHDGYLISNYYVVKDATKVRLLTGVGLIDVEVVHYKPEKFEPPHVGCHGGFHGLTARRGFQSPVRVERASKISRAARAVADGLFASRPCADVLDGATAGQGKWRHAGFAERGFGFHPLQNGIRPGHD
jgi:hypothetical protein